MICSACSATVATKPCVDCGADLCRSCFRDHPCDHPAAVAADIVDEVESRRFLHPEEFCPETGGDA